jgi:tRNA-splicing ligase RtcB
MCIAELKGKNVPIKLWTELGSVEPVALDQLKNIAALPWVFKHVAVMPDVHYGKGATVGSVIAMKDAVSPAAVGVDIGCGMAAVKTNLSASDLPESLTAIRSAIEAAIPVGFNSHKEPVVTDFKYTRVKNLISHRDEVLRDFDGITDRFQANRGKVLNQAGTLGGGNHFIEFCLDTEGGVWLMLHSGSRYIGKELAEYHIGIARTLAHNAELPDKDLAVFLVKTPEMQAYRRDLFWAQRYAYLNRLTMLELYLGALADFFPALKVGEAIVCHHNYVSEEVHFGDDVIVTRKGAISARNGELGIIPGSMGTKSYIVRGRGNADSFTSASHGAGRRMSRGQAKRTFTEADLAAQTHGVECRKDAAVIDEIPGAYKDIDTVIANQRDLVEVVHELKQILCVKG